MKSHQGTLKKPISRPEIFHLKKYALLASLFWCAVIFLSLFLNYQQRSQHMIDIGITIARSSFDKDILYRRWNAVHGGVYVKQTEKTPPNPYLTIPERDIATSSGEPLTMVNPAYMTRQVHELGALKNGVQGHITSLNPIRPENQPDPWERQALEKIEHGTKEVSSIEMWNGEPYLRYMQVLVTEDGCLKCHSQQGYKLGQVRGGISQSVPMSLIQEPMAGSLKSLWISHVGIFLIGLFFIWLAYWRLSLANFTLKLAETSLLESQETFRKLFEGSPDPILLIDGSGVFVECNQATLDLLKMTREQFLHLPPAKISPEFQPDGQRSEQAALDKITLAYSNNGHRFDWNCVNAAGDEFVVEVSLIPVTIKGQAMLHTTWRDITQRKRLENSLRESEERFKAMFRKHSAVMLLVDPESGSIVDANLAAETFYGYSHKELLKSNIQHLNTLNPVQIAQEMQKAKREKRNYFVFNHKDSGGNVHTVEVHSTPIQVTNTDLLFSIIHDISDRKKAEEEKLKLENQLHQAQKIESIGQLAGGVAHDFNNMLGVITGHAELALMKAEKDQPLAKHLEQIHLAAKKSAELTRQLLTFARKQAISPKTLDLNITVSGMLKMLQRLIGEHIQLSWNPASSLWPVRVDPSQVDQILANLCVNARDAIVDNGKITISTQNKSFDEAYIQTLPYEQQPGDYVQLTVSDDGRGMDKDVQNHIFEPFYTTKEAGAGTGLGLATVYGAVKQNQGFITFNSETGQGTTINIFLPRERSAVEALQQPASECLSGGSETILLVEDDQMLLQLGSNMLEECGYRVLTAESPAIALSLAEKTSEPIHLLISDLIMPGMNGRDLAANLTPSHPSIKVLFMSGYSAEIISKDGTLEEGIHFLQKPVSIDALAKKVRELLDEKRI